MEPDVCWIIGGFFAFLCVLWIFLETHYFIQVVITIVGARYFKKKVGIMEETTYHGICSTTDIDVFFNHMNNTRYLRDVDFARSDFYNRTRLYGKIREKKGGVLVGANSIVYRRPIRPLAWYKITSKIVYWDNKSIFMEHHFYTTKDNLECASIVSQQRVSNCDAEALLRELHGLDEPMERPTMPEEVARMTESIKSVYKPTNEMSVKDQNQALATILNGDESKNGIIPRAKLVPVNGSNGIHNESFHIDEKN